MAGVDWSKRAEYIRSRHGIDPDWADQAVDDVEAVWLQPDPASRSGRSVRVIGYSGLAGEIVTVVIVEPDDEDPERPQGEWWGANAWIANERDRRLYGKEDG